MKNSYFQPAAVNNLIPTMNAMGHMLTTPEEYNQAFIEYASPANGPCLEIRAAYGLSTIPALENGAYVVANDLDSRHLKILQDKVPFAVRDRLQLMPGKMPDDLHFEEATFGAILASRVINFISPDQLEESIKAIFHWLKPNGKFFVVVATPFNYKDFPKIYEERKEAGDLWPGLIDDIERYSPDHAYLFPGFINLLDKEIMVKLLTTAGFIIEKVGFSPAEDTHPEELRFDGREHIGIIALKP
jgi:SAM-dependent methyltransferase